MSKYGNGLANAAYEAGAEVTIMTVQTISQKTIKELEKKYGKHNFCYQCGNPDLKPVEDAHIWPKEYRACPKCGSSDLDE